MALNDTVQNAPPRWIHTKHFGDLRRLGIVVCASRLLTAPVAAFAATPDVVDLISEVARSHFDHALTLLDQGHPDQALVEFQAAYQIKPSPTVLYNVGLTYVALQQPVEAVEAFAQYLALGGPGIPKLRRDAVETEITRQQGRIAVIYFDIRPAGASVTLDGKDLGHARTTESVKVASGRHLIEVTAAGYQKTTHELSADGLQTINLVLALSPIAPSASPAPTVATGQLTVQVAPSAARLWIDGTPSSSQVTLPSGVHVVSVNKFGYAPWNQSVPIAANTRSILKVALVPSEEFMNDRRRRSQVQRNWAYGLGASGIALAGAALGVYLWNDTRAHNWHATQSQLDASWSQPPYPSELQQRQTTNDELSSSIHRADQVTVGLAVSGGLLLTSGIVLWATGRDRTEPTSIAVTAGSRGGTLRYSSSW